MSHVDGRPVRTPKQFHAVAAGKTGPVELRRIPDDGSGVQAIRVGP